MGVKVGNEVGYQIRFEDMTSKRTKNKIYDRWIFIKRNINR